jgi:hypothetical protein
VALTLVIDSSGSMGDNVGGMSKMDLAKEAALGALDLLTPADQLGVIAFEDQPRWAIELEPLSDAVSARQRIQRLAPGGGTAIYPALESAFQAVVLRDAKVRHIVLLTDGISPSGDYPGLTRRLRDNNITLSTIGVGNDVDANLLQQLAEQGGGRYYEGSDPFQVPQIMVKETLEVARTAIVEETFRPIVVGTSPILDGLNPATLPALRGYLALTPKPAALVLLGTRQGDPLLAEWQYGLGQVVAWTSDGINRWSSDWIEWPEFSKFWSQVVKRTVPARVDQNIQTTVVVDGDRARLTVEALNDDRTFRNGLTTTATVVDPLGTTGEVTFEQIGPGRYETTLPIRAGGPHLLQIQQRDPADGRVLASQATGFVTSTGQEYWQLRPNRGLLTDLARASGGRELADLREAYAHNLRAPGAGVDLWPMLVSLALALFLVDVGVRRLRVSMARPRRAVAGLLARVRPGRREVIPTVPRPALARLLAARAALGPGGGSGEKSLASRLAAARTASNQPRATVMRASTPMPPKSGAARRGSGAIGTPTTRPAGIRPAAAPPSKPTSTDPAATGATASRLLAARNRARKS